MSRRIKLVVVYVLIMSLFFPIASGVLRQETNAYAQTFTPIEIARYSFDDGTVQGWASRGGGVQVTPTTEQKHEGTHSLLTTGRTAGWNGPSLNVLSLLKTGGTYRIIAYGRFKTDPGTGTRLTMVMENRQVGGSTAWSWINNHTISNMEWTKFEGSFTVNQPMELMQLYFESGSATAEFYIDSITITMTTPYTGWQPPEQLPQDPPVEDLPSFTPVEIERYSFDDETVQGWISRGPVTLTATSEQSQAGTHSLLTTGRTGAWNGPSLDVREMFKVGGTYEITAYVRFKTEVIYPNNTLTITIQNTPQGGTQDWHRVDSKVASSTGWTQLKGNISIDVPMTELLLYVESPNETAEFYIDSITITMTTPYTGWQPPEQLPQDPPVEDLPSFTPVEIEKYSFDDGTVQGWASRGPVTLTATSEQFQAGTHSLLTTGRTAGWNGPSLDVREMFKVGGTYEITAYVRFKTEVIYPNNTLTITIQNTPQGGTQGWHRVDSKAASSTGWTQLKGNISIDVPMTELLLYVESPNATAEFYIDSITINMTEPYTGLQPPEEEPPVLDQTGIIADFEDGTTQGFRARMGTETVTVSNAYARTGNYGLGVSNRLQPFHGTSINAFGKMHLGHRYNISVWVRLAAGEPPKDMRLTVQRTHGGTNNFDSVVLNTRVTADAWVRLSGIYQMNHRVDALQVYVESATGLGSFMIDDFELRHIPVLPIQTDIPSLKNVFADYFSIGAAVEPQHLEGRHREMLLKHYNLLVAENVMKPVNIQPTEGIFNWIPADRIRYFARENNMKFRFHTLVWHSQVPAWFFLDEDGSRMIDETDPVKREANKNLLLRRMETHIRTIVQRYRDDVDYWEVVNEVIDPNSPNGMRNSEWYQITGKEFIKRAFQVTREEAGEDALLFINDYNTHNPRKRDFLYDLVMDLRREGIRVDGIGHQTHINIEYPAVELIGESIEKFARAGFMNHITELDISVYTDSVTSHDEVPADLLIRLAHRYRDLFEVFRNLNEHIQDMTFWGIADDHSWLHNRPIPRRDAPFLFDEQFQAKDAFWAVVDPERPLPILINRLDISRGTPDIDGMDETLWKVQKSTSINSGLLEAYFRLLWNDGYLYLLADVSDTTIDQSDVIEVFVGADGQNHKFMFERLLEDNETAVVTSREGGYVLEARINAPITLALNDEISFDVRVKDATGDRTLSWNNLNHTQETDHELNGILVLNAELGFTEAIKGTPVIDAQMDPIWNNANEIVTNTRVIGNEGASARIKTMWDEEKLYIYVQVNDNLLSKTNPNRWEQDSVEIFVDQNNAKSYFYQADDGQFRVNFDNEQSFGGNASAANFISASRIIEGGYIIEASIAFDRINPQQGQLIGFDIQVNDDNGEGRRTGKVTWNDPTGLSFRNTSRFGVLRLIEKPDMDEPPVVPVTGVKVTPEIATINVGGRQQLSVAITPANATDKKVTWTSSNESVAAVDENGLVIGVRVGTAIITVASADGNYKDTSTITVFAPEVPQLPTPEIPTPEIPTPEIPAPQIPAQQLPVQLAVEQPIAQDKQTVTKIEGVVTVTVQAGAIAGESPKLKAEVMPEVDSQELVKKAVEAGFTPIGEIVILKVTGGEFIAPVSLSFDFDEARIPAGQVPSIFVYNERTGRWIYLGGQINNGSITLSVNRFSKFGVFAARPISPLTDIKTHWAKNSISTMAGMGVVEGFPDGNFRPDATATRAEFIAMLIRALGIEEEPEAAVKFKDANELGWAKGVIGAAVEASLISGMPGGNIEADRKITRAEMVAILQRVIQRRLVNVRFKHVLRFDRQENIPGWARSAFITTGEVGLVRGFPDGTIKPLNTATRAEIATIIYRLIAER